MYMLQSSLYVVLGLAHGRNTKYWKHELNTASLLLGYGITSSLALGEKNVDILGENLRSLRILRFIFLGN